MRTLRKERERRPDESLQLLNRARRYLEEMKKTLENQKQLEKELIQINKITIRELEKEKDA